MKIKTLALVVALCAAASSPVACEQAKVVCTVGHAGSQLSYAVKYYARTTPAPACAVAGEVIGFETFHPPGGGDDGTQPDFSKPTIVALQSESLLNLALDKGSKGSVDTAAAHQIYAVGPFGAVEPEDGFCTLPDATLKPAEQHFPKIDAVAGMGGADPGLPAEPDTDVKYTWKNVKVYVTAGAQGTQFTADLSYSRADDKGTCAVDYQVLGVWPQVTCDPMNPVACCPDAAANGERNGSGINPDFPVRCDPDLLLCVLDAPDAATLPVLAHGWADPAKHPECR